MDKFWELLGESVIFQGVLVLLVWGAIVYLSVVGKEVPDILTQGGALIVGFFFGAKQQVAAISAARKIVESSKHGKE